MLSILPSQRGNSELCWDAVACDGPPSLPSSSISSSNPSFLCLLSTIILLSSLACRTLSPRCAFAATTLGPRAPSDAPRDARSTMHGISRTWRHTPGHDSGVGSSLIPSVNLNAKLTPAISTSALKKTANQHENMLQLVIISLPFIISVSILFFHP